MTKDVKIKTPKIRKSASLEKRKARAGWIFVLPFVIGFVVVYLPMIFDSIQLSFCHLQNTPTGYELTPVGWQNYSYALVQNTSFGPLLFAGMKDLVFDVPMILMFSLFMAVLLNQKMAGRALFRAIFFVPVIVSTGIMEVIDAQNAAMSENMEGGINDGSGGEETQNILMQIIDLDSMFEGVPLLAPLVDYVGVAIDNVLEIVNRSGVQMLIFLAGLQSISPAIYESVQVDGATAWETFWKITFPMISPMILVNAVYTIIDAFTTDSNIVISFIMSPTGIPQDQLQTITSAMAWMYFLLVIAIIGLFALIFSAFVFYQRRD